MRNMDVEYNLFQKSCLPFLWNIYLAKMLESNEKSVVFVARLDMITATAIGSRFEVLAAEPTLFGCE